MLSAKRFRTLRDEGRPVTVSFATRKADCLEFALDPHLRMGTRAPLQQIASIGAAFEAAAKSNCQYLYLESYGGTFSCSLLHVGRIINFFGAVARKYRVAWAPVCTNDIAGGVFCLYGQQEEYDPGAVHSGMRREMMMYLMVWELHRWSVVQQMRLDGKWNTDVYKKTLASMHT